MQYNQLKELVSTIEEGKKFEFDLSNVNNSISDELDDFINLSSTLNLFNAKINEIGDQITSFYGEVRLRNSNAYFETNVVLINNDPFDYIITIEPNGKWLNKVNRNIKKVLKFLPVGFSDTIFINSSITTPKATISFDENTIYQIAIEKGSSLATHVKSDLLKILNLPDTLFFVNKTEEGTYRIFKDLRFNVDLAGILKLEVERINLNNKNSFLLESNLELPFLNYPLDCSVAVTSESYQTRVKLEDDVRLPIQDILKGLEIANLELDLQGSFINPNNNVYGLSGNFAIGEPVTTITEHDFSYQSLKSNEFNIKFNPINSSYIPVFLQAFVDEISMSKAVALITGTNPNLPRFIDPIKLYSTYIYYCAPNQQGILFNGVIAQRGIAISSGINILGLDAYCEFSALENRTKGNVVLEPIDIPNLLKIGGDSEGTPVLYNGPKIEKGGVQLFFDSDGPIYFRTDVIVNLFDLFEFKTGANIQEKGLQFYHDIDLGIVRAQCNCLLKSIDDFQFNSEFDATIIGLKTDLGPLGKLSLNLDISAKIYFAIKLRTSSGLATLEVSFNVNGTRQLLRLTFNIKELKNVEKHIRQELLEFIENLILSPLEWLKSILSGIIRIAEDVLEEAKEIAGKLEKVFNKTIEQSAKLLKNAGYEAEKAARVLLNGFSNSANDVAKVLLEVKYPVEKISKALIDLTEKTAKEVFEVMKDIGAPIEEIGKGLKSFGTEVEKVLKELNLTDKEAAALLKGLGKSVKDQAQGLKDILNVGKKAADSALRAVGNAPNQVKDAVDAVFGGGGGGCRTICVVRKPFPLSGCAVTACV